jgi:murein DD-endopeptidase MepM/ murein hydrolase activator NlpD
LFLLAACTPGERFQPRLPAPELHHSRPQHPSIEPLVVAGPRETWERAGARALSDAVPVERGFSERLVLTAAEPEAVAYEVTLRAGEQLRIFVEAEGPSAGYSLEVFERVRPDSFRVVRSFPAPLPHAGFTAPADGRYLVRFRNEPGTFGTYRLSLGETPTLSFPVAGHDMHDIRSPYGSTRDGGSRRHEGVDIFAGRGTPVVSASAALVTRVETTPSGGRVIWAEDEARGLTYYYAHLDEQLVRRGTRVSPGDTIGRVGNSGNARKASPHLHFSVYRPGLVPLDPTPMLAGAALVPTETRLLGSWARTASSGVRLRMTPSIQGPVLAELEQGTAMRVVGETSDWYRVRLADGRAGFVAGRLLASTSLATH